MPLRDPELIIFDWDGTLVDSFDLLYAAHNHVRRAMDLTPWSEDEARHYIRASAREIYPEIYGDSCDDAIKLLYNFVEQHHIAKLAAMPSAKELLSFIHNETSIPMAVVSNKNQHYLEREIASLKWYNYFSCIVGAGRAERDKPSSAPIDFLFNKLESSGIPAPDNNKVWFVGDTETDMICAQAAHITPVFIRCGFGNDDIIEKYKPKAVINDCKNLHYVLQHDKM